MNKLPISVVFMTSTKGHWGHKDVYLKTLNHWDKHIPWSEYATKVAHIKVTPGEEAYADVMTQELERRGFTVLKTIASWTRGMSHQNQYLLDQIKISKHIPIYGQPYVLFIEDDSIVITKDNTLDNALCQMMAFLENPDILSFRFMRTGDWPPAGKYSNNESQTIWYHEHINFQPLIMRSNQFYMMLKTAEDNMDQASQIQIEMLWRLLLAPYSRSQLPHAVWNRDYMYTAHLGVPDYTNQCSLLNLS